MGANLGARGLEQIGGLVEERAARAGPRLRPGRKGCGRGIDGTLGIVDAGGGGARGDLAGHGVEAVEGGAAGRLGLGVVDEQVDFEHGRAPGQCVVRSRLADGQAGTLWRAASFWNDRSVLHEQRKRLGGNASIPERAGRIGRPQLAAQIGTAHGRVALQVAGRTLADDAAVLQEIAAAADRQTLRSVLLDQQHADAEVLDAAERLEQLLAHQRREAERRLVEQQHLRVRHQGPADGQHLPLAAAHGAGELAHALGETGEEGQHLLQVGGLVRARAGEIGAEQQVLVHGEVGEDAAVLRHQRQARLDDGVRGHVREVDAAEPDARARHVRDHAAQRLQAGRLAGAVGAQHDHDLAGAHAERHPVEREVLAVADGEVGDLEHGFPQVGAMGSDPHAPTDFKERSRAAEGLTPWHRPTSHAGAARLVNPAARKWANCIDMHIPSRRIG